MSFRDLVQEALVQVSPEVVEALASGLQRIEEGGREAWPGLGVSERALAFFVLHHAGDARALPGDLIAADLYLAAACASGDARGLEAFERAHWPALRGALGVRGLDDPSIDEILQQLRQHLFLPRKKSAPAIFQYNGQHPLRAWLRVVAMRLALMHLRGRKDHRELQESRLAAAVADGANPELRYLRQRCHADFKPILQRVVGGLPERDRSLLRQYYVHGMTFASMATVYHVDPSRPRRWLERIRDRVRAETRCQLVEQLGLTPTDCESFIRVLGDEFELTLSRILPAE